MLGSGKGTENEQRFWNFVLLKAPCTDKELPYVMLGSAVVIAIIGLIYIIVKLLS